MPLGQRHPSPTSHAPPRDLPDDYNSYNGYNSYDGYNDLSRRLPNQRLSSRCN